MNGNRIAEWRLARGLSQDALANRLGCTRQTMNRLENGHRKFTLNWMERIGTALGVRPADLLPDAPPPDQPLPKPAAVLLNPPAASTPQKRRLVLLHQLLDTMQQAAGEAFTAERRAELQVELEALLDANPSLWNAAAAPAPPASVVNRRQKQRARS